MYIHLSFFCSTKNAVFFYGYLLVIVKDWCSEKTSNALLPY